VGLDFQSVLGELAELKRQAVNLPSLDVLLCLDQSRLVHTLKYTATQSDLVKKVVDCIVQLALQPEFRPMEVYESGSFKRGTALCNNFDVDLVVKLRSFDFKSMTEYHRRCQEALVHTFGHVVTLRFTPTTLVLMVDFGDLHMDVVFTEDLSDNRSGNPRAAYEGADSASVDESIKHFKRCEPLYFPLVLLCKHWRNEQPAGCELKSYHIELLCYHLLMSMSPAFDSLRLDVRVAFWLVLLELMVGNTQVDNLNPISPPHFEPSSEKDLRALQARAADTFCSYFDIADPSPLSTLLLHCAKAWNHNIVAMEKAAVSAPST